MSHSENNASVPDALVMVDLRNTFYRKKFRFSLGLYVLSIMVNIFLVGIIFYVTDHPVEALYFPADRIGRLVRVVPLHEPNMTLQDVTAWTIEAVEAAYSYDFINYHGQLQNAQKYFTGYGWRNYMRALSASNNFKALTERKFVVVAKVVEAPRLLNQGIVGGAQAWKFQMPVLVTYLMPPFDDKSKFSNPLILTVIVQRQNVLQSYKGLGILQVIANIASGSGQR